MHGHMNVKFVRKLLLLMGLQIQSTVSTSTSIWEGQCQVLRYLKVLKLQNM